MNNIKAWMVIDLADPNFLAGDRTQAYERLHAQAPVWHLGEQGGVDTWVLSRHSDIHAVLRIAQGRVQQPGLDAPPWLDAEATLDRLHANLAQTDDPLHTRLRSVVGPMFVPRNVEALRSVSADSVACALRAMPRGEPFDLVTQLAAQVPKGVICHLLGIPESDWDQLTKVQHDFLPIFSLFPITEEEKRRLEQVIVFYRDYFASVLAAAERSGAGMFAQVLLAAERAGSITRSQSVSLMHTVLDAGFETTRTSISNAVELLAQQPALFDLLRAAPDIIAAAIEEILRVRTPIQARHRFLAAEFVASDGSRIPAGAQALLLLGAGNRDDRMFPEPSRIDFTRANANRHLAFGGGLHHCLGAPVARIQLQETLRGLVNSFKRFTLPEGTGKRHALLKFPSLIRLQVIAH